MSLGVEKFCEIFTYTTFFIQENNRGQQREEDDRCYRTVDVSLQFKRKFRLRAFQFICNIFIVSSSEHGNFALLLLLSIHHRNE